MNYNVQRGLREIVAPSHRMRKSEWTAILKEFSQRCAYCGRRASRANRGIVPDHLIAVTDFGELVAGNTVPACQTCNDSRGNKEWQEFLLTRFPADASSRIAKIEAHVRSYGYVPRTRESSLLSEELAEYDTLLKQWGQLLERAQALRASVAARRVSGS